MNSFFYQDQYQSCLQKLIFEFRLILILYQVKTMRESSQSQKKNEGMYYLKITKQGVVQGIKQGINYLNPPEDHSYCRVHFHEPSILKQFTDSDKFSDPQFKIDLLHLSSAFSCKKELKLLRISQAIQWSQKKVKFWQPLKLNKKCFESQQELPLFVFELNLLPVEHFRSFFITNDFNQQGKYKLAISRSGSRQIILVDDLIPVDGENLEPLWGIQIFNPWALILVKAWAKQLGGYHKILEAEPMSFLKTFSTANWKLINLDLQKQTFFKKHSGIDKIKEGKFFVKSKNNSAVKCFGLRPNCLGYQIKSITKIKSHSNTTQNSNNPEDAYKTFKCIITLRSTTFSTQISLYNAIDEQFERLQQAASFSKMGSLTLEQQDFFNLFSSVYIASGKQFLPNLYFSDQVSISFQSFDQNSQYLKFVVSKKDCWLNFSLHKKQICQSDCQNQQFFQPVTLILAKSNSKQFQSSFKNEQDFNPLPYDTYSIERVLNRFSSTNFIQLAKGQYILQIKTQQLNSTPLRYTFTFTSPTPFEVSPWDPKNPQKQRSLLLQAALSSLIPFLDRYCCKEKFEDIVFGNTFQLTGYGFVGVRCKKSSPYKIFIEVDQSIIAQSGYELDTYFHNFSKPFSIEIKPGETSSVVLKKIKCKQNRFYKWPPQGIKIYRSNYLGARILDL